MDKPPTTVEANRRFSHTLRLMRAGETCVLAEHGTPVGPGTNLAAEARQALLACLMAEPVVDIGHWTRDELYER